MVETSVDFLASRLCSGWPRTLYNGNLFTVAPYDCCPLYQKTAESEDDIEKTLVNVLEKFMKYILYERSTSENPNLNPELGSAS
jgi:hypothetical protein